MWDPLWFVQWFEELQERLHQWGERIGAFFHRGVWIAPSGRWMQWVAVLSPTTCEFCKDTHGKVIDPKDRATFPILDGKRVEPPAHPNCRCKILPLPAMKAGTASIQGEEGADWYLTYLGVLPENYLTKAEACALGWQSRKGNLGEVAPGRLIGGDIYWNANMHLPVAPHRVWFEADINYTHGYRGKHKVFYSNDHLVFVTYDHGFTFIEIVQ